MWNYLYFMIRLNKEDNNIFNGLEHYVFLKYVNDETDWIPQYNFLQNNDNMRKIN